MSEWPAVAESLRLALKAQGKWGNTAKVSRDSEVSHTTWYKLLRGERVPSEVVHEKISDYLGLPEDAWERMIGGKVVQATRPTDTSNEDRIVAAIDRLTEQMKRIANHLEGKEA